MGASTGRNTIRCRTRKCQATKGSQFGTALAALVTSLFLLASPSYAGWTEIGTSEMYRVVLVDSVDIHDARIYWGAIRNICRARHCNVIFVSDKALAPATGERFTNAQLKEALLIYNTDKGFRWNCALRLDADNCFTN